MSGAIYEAAAGALVQQMRLDMLSNNLANGNTTGYKSDVAIFRIPSVDESQPSITSIPGLLSPNAPPLEAMTDFSAGPVVKTGNPLDTAIVGDGFFEVQSSDGPKFTRNGSFSINDQGVLSNAQGWPVMGQSGEIAIDGGQVVIGDQGEVYVDGDQVDTLRVVDFPQPYELRKCGESLFVPVQTGQEEILDDGYHISQGFVEASNVDTIRTMTEMIETLRVFESYQKVIRAADDTLAKTVNEVGTA